ncbi:MAG: OmpA family protein [Bacteroidetes bacterium]|nr:OmpA family protein [Bacteroidota bacterium]
MRKVFSVFSCLMVYTGLSLGQGKLQHSVYFDTDQSVLRADQARLLNAWLDSVLINNIHSVEITGHTDSDADSLYNIRLSDNRCKTVTNQLLAKGFSPDLLHVSYHGENYPIAANNNSSGKQQNRRVDIVIHYKAILVSTEIEPVVIDTCEGIDTTLIFEDGTRMVFNKCEYSELKECLEIKLWNDIREAQRDGVSMRDDDGNQLVSNGMFSITLKSKCKNIECFKNKVKVLIPLNPINYCDYCMNNQRLYIMNSAGQWVLDESRVLEIVEIDSVKYIQVEVQCPGKVNFDCKLPEGVKLKFKVPDDYVIQSLQLVNVCPRAIISFNDKRKPDSRVANVPCWDNWLVYTTILTPAGDTIVIDGVPLEKAGNNKIICSKCAKDKSVKSERVLGIFPSGKRAHYRKYKLSKKYLSAL